MDDLMPHSELPPKTKRIIEHDLQTLFSPRAFISGGIDAIRKLGQLALFREVKYNRRSLFLSDEGAAALKRLTNSIHELPTLADSVSRREVEIEAKSQYEELLRQHLQADGQEFTDSVTERLLAAVREYQVLIKLDGLNLMDQDCIDLGALRIQKADKALLNSMKCGGLLDKQEIFKLFDGTVWLVGRVAGSPDIARERFGLNASLAVGLLGVCAAILYPGALWRTSVHAMLSPTLDRKPAPLLVWEHEKDYASLSFSGKGTQDLPLDSGRVNFLIKECFLKEMASLIGKPSRTELQDAVVRAIYWMSDAYRDRNKVMQFIKLWTCMECFFAISNEGITEANAKGIASTITYGGYRLAVPSEYGETKRRVKRLYALRSKALHRAQFGHVKTSDLDELAAWVAWIIVTMVSFSQRGYTTLRQLAEQIVRLDRLSAVHEVRGTK
jgi:hypothetical protein